MALPAQTAPTPDPAGAPDWLLDAGLAATAALFAFVRLPDSVSIGLVLGLMVHVLVGLYHGRFGRLRKLTWPLFLIGWTASFLIADWGGALQVLFWPEVQSPFLEDKRLIVILLAVAGAFAAIGALLDIVALHGPRVRGRRTTQLVAGMWVLAVLVLVRDVVRVVSGAGWPHPPQILHIVMPIEYLPLYSLLRAIPSKSLGAAFPAALAMLAALWPWRRAGRFHAPPTQLAFTLMWLAAGAAWIGLGVLGALSAEPWAITASQVLGLYELAFLALAPLLLARFVRPPQDPRAVF